MSQGPSTGAMLKPHQLDDLGAAMLTLARELWVVKDRVAVLEAVLGERGVDVTAAVDAHQPGPALAAELAAERDRFARAVLTALCPALDGAA